MGFPDYFLILVHPDGLYVQPDTSYNFLNHCFKLPGYFLLCPFDLIDQCAGVNNCVLPMEAIKQMNLGLVNPCHTVLVSIGQSEVKQK